MSTSTLSTESFYTTLEQKFSTVFFYLNGIVANSSHPFRILINDECILKLESNCNNVVYATQVEEPRVGGHHFIRVKVDCPLLRLGSGLSSHYERYNLSINGFFILIDCSGISEEILSVIQQKHDNFGSSYKNYKFGNEETENEILKVSSLTKNLINSNLPPKKIEEQLKKLEQLFRKDILTREEFEAKWKMVYNPKMSELESTYDVNSSVSNNRNHNSINHSQNTTTTNSELTPDQIELLSKLRGLIPRGIITQEEYNAKLERMKQENSTQLLSSTTNLPVGTESVSCVILTREQEQMLGKLESLLSKGILTQEEFEIKKKQIVGINSNGSLDSSSSKKIQSIELPNHSETLSYGDYVQRYEDLKSMMNESQKHQMRTLERFVNDGIINQDEYEMKKKKVLGNLYTPTVWSYQKKLLESEQSPSTPNDSSKNSPSTPSESLNETQKERIEKLEKLKERGILTNEMFDSRRQQILDENKPIQDTDDYSHLSSDQQNYIAKLKYFKKMGILTPSEFDIQLERAINDPESITKNGGSAIVASPQQSRTITPSSASSSPKTPIEDESINKQSTPPTINLKTNSSIPIQFTSEEIDTPITPTSSSHNNRHIESTEKTPPEQAKNDKATQKLNMESQNNKTKQVVVPITVETSKKQATTSASTNNASETNKVIKESMKESPISSNNVTELDEEIQDQLERLKSLVDMGIISEEDYKQKEEKLLRGISTPSSPSASSVTPVDESKPVVLVNQQATNNQIKQLEKLYNSGIISKEDFDQKVNKLLGKTTPEVKKKEQNSPSVSPRNTTKDTTFDQNIQIELTKLKKLLDNGIISQEQFEMKQSKLLASQSTEKELTSEQKEQIAKLKSFLEQGLIDKDEYEDELNQILKK